MCVNLVGGAFQETGGEKMGLIKCGLASRYGKLAGENCVSMKSEMQTKLGPYSLRFLYLEL